jgi:hypothetical protein
MFSFSVPVTKLCKRNQQSFLSSIPIPIDGAVVTSRNERDVDCTITFQTESILERFMIRFEELAIDCNDKLYLFDGAHAIGSHKVSFCPVLLFCLFLDPISSFFRDLHELAEELVEDSSSRVARQQLTIL